jgi:hypothetical protein
MKPLLSTIALIALTGCASTAAVQNRPTAPRPDVVATQLASDQMACEKTAQETRPSHALAILGGGFLIGAAVSNSDYEELYVQCMKTKGYAFTEGTGR